MHLYRVVREFRPDFIIAHATLAALYVRLLPVHTLIAWVMHSGVNDFENGALKRAERLLSRRASAIIGVSQQNLDDYMREIGRHPSMVVIPNGVDASQFAAPDATPAHDSAVPPKQIVQLGRYIEARVNSTPFARSSASCRGNPKHVCCFAVCVEEPRLSPRGGVAASESLGSRAK